MNKQDFLRECMSGFGIVPHDEFKKAYCLRCLNQDCTWSVGATTSFVHRVQNWEERLFTKVDRANDDDPNYEEVRAKRFLPMTPGLGSVNTGFISPNMPQPEPVQEPEPETVPEMDLPTSIDNNIEEEAPLTEPNPEVQEPLELMDPEDEETETEQEVPDLDALEFDDETSPDVKVPDLDGPPAIPEVSEEELEEINFGMVQNTNFQQGTMLGDAKKEKIIPAGGTVILDDE